MQRTQENQSPVNFENHTLQRSARVPCRGPRFWAFRQACPNLEATKFCCWQKQSAKESYIFNSLGKTERKIEEKRILRPQETASARLRALQADMRPEEKTSGKS